MNSYRFFYNNENNLASHPDARFIPGLGMIMPRFQSLKRKIHPLASPCPSAIGFASGDCRAGSHGGLGGGPPLLSPLKKGGRGLREKGDS